jgi:CDP-glucose 4,6-dehydratase
MTPGFWSGRPVFVTGHTGFKGAWLTLWLQQLGARVTGYALDPPTQPNLFTLARVDDSITDVRGDVRDLTALEKALGHARPEVILHLAAQSLVRQSYESPVETYATNVMGTVHVLDALRRVPSVRAAVIVTSDKCYENIETDRAYREEDALGGYDPYSSSKGCAEIVTAAYRRSYFDRGEAGIGSARAGNVIGGGDWARDRLLPDLLCACAEGRSALIRNPRSTRPWQHVLEPLRGYLLLAERLHGGTARGSWNFGPLDSDIKSVSWIADAVARGWPGSSWQTDGADHPHEARTLKLDIGKARRELGWEPVLTVDEAVAWTVRWHRELQDGGSARALMLRDIEAYSSRLAALHGHGA